MKHISILVPEGAIMGSIVGPHQVFSEVNGLLENMGRKPLFDVHLVGLHRDTKSNAGAFTVHADAMMEDVKKTDLILIPALQGDLPQAIETNKAFIPWMVEHYKKGAEVGSLCIGAFLLAASGLLNGRKASTHWIAADGFRKMFPEVQLVPEKILTDEDGLYSSGGAFSYLNLIMYLVEKFAGREVAVMAAKIFQVDIDRGSQSPFMMFQGQKDHEDELVKRAQEYIEKNYTEKITVDQLADMLSIGRRNLERRFKKETSCTVLEYIQRIKIEAAKMSLESTRENVNEVMYKVGYTDTKAFRATFKRFTGTSPLEYRNRYNRTLAVA